MDASHWAGVGTKACEKRLYTVEHFSCSISKARVKWCFIDG